VSYKNEGRALDSQGTASLAFVDATGAAFATGFGSATFSGAEDVEARGTDIGVKP